MEAIDTLAIFGLPSPVATSAHSGVSPSNSSAEDFDFDMQDDLAQFLGGTDNDDQSSHGDDGVKKRGRRPPSTAAKRATHNAVERARRESLNDRFMELAADLPNMAMSKRPSKNSIVEHAIEYVKQAKSKDTALTKENASLLEELNALRAQLGMPARPALEPIVEVPTGKAPSKRPSTIPHQPAKPKPAVVVAAPTPIVTAVAPAAAAAVSPRTVSAPAVMPNPYMQPAAFDWTPPHFDAFTIHAFDPSVYAPGTQTGGGFNSAFAWQTAAPFAYAHHPAVPGLA